MPKNGRPPKPTQLKILHGETRPSQINQNEPTLPPKMPDAPEEFNVDELAEWNRLVPLLDKMGILTEVDQLVLGMLCSEIANYKRLRKLLKDSSPLLADRDGKMRKNPLNQLVRDSSLLCARLAYEFGLTPSARTKLISTDWDAETDLERMLS